MAAARADNARPVAEDITRTGGQAEAMTLDVTDGSAAETAMAGILERHGRIDILVNNAGIARDQLLLRMKRDDWDAVLTTNLTAAFALTQAALKSMIRQRQRTHYFHQLGRRPERQPRPGELRGVESRADWLYQSRRSRGRLARNYRKRRGAGPD